MTRKTSFLNVMIFLNFSTIFKLVLECIRITLPTYDRLIGDKSQMESYIFYFDILFLKMFKMHILKTITERRPIGIDYGWFVLLSDIRKQFPEFCSKSMTR